MKQIFLILLLVVSYLGLIGQPLTAINSNVSGSKPTFVAQGDISATSDLGSEQYSITLVNRSELLGNSTFIATNSAIGDIIIDGNGGIYEIISGTSPTFTVQLLNDPLDLPEPFFGFPAAPTPPVNIARPIGQAGLLPSYAFLGSGIDSRLIAIIDNYNKNQLGSKLVVQDATTVEAFPFGSITATDVQGQLEQVFASIAPDQTVSITGAGSVAVTGTYPNFTATGSGLTGTGTIDYVPKFTTTGAIGNSNIFDNGTNVGIGTTTPLRKLTVSGPETQIRLESTGTGGVDNWLEMVNTSTSIVAANIIQFYKRGGDNDQRHVSIGMPKSSLDSTLYVGITNDSGNDLQNGFIVNMQAGTDKGFVRAEAYSSNRTKTAESLGKTQSAHLAGFATDGTFIHVPMSNGTIAATPDGSGDITVTHTLGSTPTIVQLTAKGTTTPYILSWHSEDGSTFKIRVLDASVSPPVAVTTGTISISWNARIN